MSRLPALIKSRTDSGFWLASEQLKAHSSLLVFPDNPRLVDQSRTLVKGSKTQGLTVIDPALTLIEASLYHQAHVFLIGEGLDTELVKDFNTLVGLGIPVTYIRG